MSETTLIWLFGAMGGWLVILSGVMVKVLINQVRLRYALELFIDGVGKRAAKLLHSPDDHLGIDALLDTYIDHHHDLSLAQWEDFLKQMEAVFNNSSSTVTERSLAAFLAELCRHKLSIKPGGGTKPVFREPEPPTTQ